MSYMVLELQGNMGYSEKRIIIKKKKHCLFTVISVLSGHPRDPR